LVIRTHFIAVLCALCVLCGENLLFSAEDAVDPARLAEIEALGKKGDAAALAKIVSDDHAIGAEREAAVKSLVLTKAGALALIKLSDDGKLAEELKATGAFALAGCSDEEARKLGEAKLPVPKTKDGLPLPPIAQLAEMKGDAKAGEAVFKNSKTGPNCIGCHQIGDDGKMIGPPLTTIGEKLNKSQLYEAILTPSAGILMGYELWAVKTKKGEIKTGIKKEDTDDHVTLLDNQGEYTDIPVPEVVKKTKQPISMMPEGLIGTMTRQDLVNLIEFLASRKY
jgi:putative heme-binding domain-containing protein